jgi:hypothetical protein
MEILLVALSLLLKILALPASLPLIMHKIKVLFKLKKYFLKLKFCKLLFVKYNFLKPFSPSDYSSTQAISILKMYIIISETIYMYIYTISNIVYCNILEIWNTVQHIPALLASLQLISWLTTKS